MPLQFRPLLKALGRALLFLGLLVLPTLARGAYYYRRIFVPRSVPRPDHTVVDVPTVALTTFADASVPQAEGRVIIDRAHANAIDDADLNVLLARLSARGLEVIALTPGDHLPDLLRNAISLVVIAPHQSFYPWELEAVERFVEQGGRLLLVADPSRYSLRTEYDEEFGIEYTVPSSDVAAINSAASPFGLAFADDYIYNTAENAGNYQYVILRDFTPNPLTSGLEKVVFYASHSIAAGEQALIVSDERTTSSLSEQIGGLATMSLDDSGRVLALADFTFMTEPYNSSADNGRLIANIADFLAGAERVYTLIDFPYFFGDDVDLIPVMGPPDGHALSAAMLDQGYLLQSAFESAGKMLHWHDRPKQGHDVLFVGLYGGVAFSPEVSQLLTSGGITFTLETVEQKGVTPTPTESPVETPTVRDTSTPASTSEMLRQNSEEASSTPTPTEPPLHDWINVADVGRVEAKEVTLIYQNEVDQQVVIVLAFSEEDLNTAVQRLIFGDFTRCLVDQDRKADPAAISLALCPTDYEPSEEGPTPTSTPTPQDDLFLTPTPALEGGILIVSDDNGTGIHDWWTSAYYFQDIAVNAGYEAVVWSTFVDGEVTPEQVQSYDAVIWCTGDYQEDGVTPAEEDLLILADYMAQGGRVILTGAFIGDPEESESGLLLDVQVIRADHPLTEGFELDQIITLERLASGEDYSPYLLAEAELDAVVFTRGPASEFAGQAIVAVEEDQFAGSRTVLIGFPIYLMPWEELNQLGSNAISWVMEGVGGQSQ